MASNCSASSPWVHALSHTLYGLVNSLYGILTGLGAATKYLMHATWRSQCIVCGSSFDSAHETLNKAQSNLQPIMLLGVHVTLLTGSAVFMNLAQCKRTENGGR